MTQKLMTTQAISALGDAGLVELWQQGTDEAFDVLYLRYVGELVDLAARKTGSREQAKELVQDVFLDLFRRKFNLDPQKAVKAYLFNAVRHRVYNYYREVMMRRKHEEGIASLWPAQHNEMEHQLAYNELEKLLHHSVNSLPVKCREVFVLSRHEYLSHKEIASRLNISVNTVEQHMRKALQRLRCSLQHYLVWVLASLAILKNWI